MASLAQDTSEVAERREPVTLKTENSAVPSPILQNPANNAKLSLPVPLVLAHGADTLVYIDPAPASPTANWRWIPQTIPHRVHSESLLGTGSPYLARLFTPRCQTRIRKQRGLAGQKLQDGIKFVIDLTPATLEDDAVIALTEVSCPMAIRTWSSRKTDWDLPAACVGGEDETQVTEHVTPLDLFEPLIVNDIDEDSDEQTADESADNFSNMPMTKDAPAASTTYHSGLPVEYSPARHVEGIENILRALEGLAVTLDTPCKLWTFFAVAKILGVATNPPIKGCIVSWFFESSNTRFIEVHPEVAYRVACGIQSATLCQYSFETLVGDEALLHVMQSAQIKPIKLWRSSYEKSRIHDMLDDIDVQRIEYASKSFADAMIMHFIHLTGAEMSWLDEIPSVKNIIDHASDFPEDAELAHSLISNLKSLTRSEIYRILKRAGDPIRSFDILPARKTFHGRKLFHKEDMVVRILSQSFWTSLEQTCSLPIIWWRETHPGGVSLPPPDIHDSIADLGRGLLLFQGQEEAKIDTPGSSYQDLKDQILQFNLKIRNPGDQEVQASCVPTETQVMDRHSQLTINHGDDTSCPATDMSPFFPMEATLPYRPRPAPLANNPGLQSTMPVPKTEVSTGHSTTESVPRYGNSERKFVFDQFKDSADAYAKQYARSVLLPTRYVSLLARSATEIVTCVTDSELKYLPLWAGGNDDESGGVFADQEIPIMDAGGFSAPGPAVHTGSTASTEHSFSEVCPSDVQSTVQGASHHATYSHLSAVMSVSSHESEELVKESTMSGHEQQRTDDLVSGDHDVLSVDMDDTHSDGAVTVRHSAQFWELSDGEYDEEMEMNASDDDDDFCDIMEETTTD